jgi:hypothetical protein
LPELWRGVKRRLYDRGMASKRALMQEMVLELWAEIYGDDMSTEEILETDPNDFDLDPSIFYESLQERFDVPFDDDNDAFGGYGGSVADTITFLTKHWDGETGLES